MHIFSTRIIEKFASLGEEFCRRLGSISAKLCPPKYLSYGKMDEASDRVIVLTPSDYWVRRIDLNVSSEKKAAAYGYSLFDLEEEFVCVARKLSEGSYEILAYQPQRLITRYPELFSTSTRTLVTFAQWVFDDLKYPIKLKNGKYLSSHEGIIFEMEGDYLDLSDAHEIDEIESKPYFRLKTLSSETMIPSGLSSKTLKLSVVILSFFLINLLVQGYQTRSASAQMQIEMEALRASSTLGGVSMERETIIETLRHKEAKQLKLRERCYALRNVPLQPRTVSIPPVASVPASAEKEGGIVLIPGSKPGEPNRLLIDGKSETPAHAIGGFEGFQEIVFDGKTTTFMIETSEPATLKKGLMKTFRNSRIEEHNGHLEVRLK